MAHLGCEVMVGSVRSASRALERRGCQYSYCVAFWQYHAMYILGRRVEGIVGGVLNFVPCAAKAPSYVDPRIYPTSLTFKFLSIFPHLLEADPSKVTI